MDEKTGEKVVVEASILEQAEAIAKRIEEANAKSQEILKKNEETISRIMLSGRSNAGQTQVAEDAETRKKKMAREFFKGTEIEKAIAKYG